MSVCEFKNKITKLYMVILNELILSINQIVGNDLILSINQIVGIPFAEMFFFISRMPFAFTNAHSLFSILFYFI